MSRRICARLAIGLGGLLLGGCVSTTHHVGEQGASWEAVLPGPGIAAALGGAPADAWYDSRRDASLAPAYDGPVLASREWPEADRPSLQRPVYIRLRRSPESFIYYRSEERFESYRGWR